MLRFNRAILFTMAALCVLILFKLTRVPADDTQFITNDFKPPAGKGAAALVGDATTNNPLSNLEAQTLKGVDTARKGGAAGGAAGKAVASLVDIPYDRANATFVTLARNRDLYSLIPSIQSVEDRFNHKYKYDWVFLNDEEFSDEFKRVTTALVSGTTKYAIIPKSMWGYPDFIDQPRADAARKAMGDKGIIYGDNLSYRHMCRFESGFFWRHPAMLEYRYYWRVEPDTKLFCDIDYDLFKFMQKENKTYGFTISIHEYHATIETLWETTKNFTTTYPQYLAPNNLLKFISNDNGQDYNLCHFWSNFEIADMEFWRGEAYTKYFEHLDRSGGFFYERWGDAPVHSIAAALFLNKSQIHHFEDVGYHHPPYDHCPTEQKVRLKGRCTCNPSNNFAWDGYSCTKEYYDAQEYPKPVGWDTQKG